jgi:ribosome biogenesis GTPase A
MHKARRQMREILPKVQLLIEVLDARIPFSSENPMLAELRGDKPCIKLLAKSDLADPEVTQVWQDYLAQQRNIHSLATTTEQPDIARRIPALCQKLLADRAASGKSIQAMIVGIPNVGKSTLINILAGRTIAKTGNEPAVTKGQQRINLGDGIILLDTPGVLWPNLENRNSGYRLATTGAIKDTAMSYDDVAFYAAEFMLSRYPDKLVERYQLEQLPDSELTLLEAIGAKRGCLRGGGQVDLVKASTAFIQDIRQGQLGRLSFETPADMARELVQLEVIRQQKADKEAAKKQPKKGSRDA